MEQQQEEVKLDLPQGWKKLNYYSLHLAYVFGTLFGLLQPDFIQKVLIKYFTQDKFDAFNAWSLILFIIFSAGAGILNHLRGKKINKIIDVIENGTKPS